MNRLGRLRQTTLCIPSSYIPSRALLAGFGGLLILVALFGRYWPVGSDYYYTFRPVAEAWLSGDLQLYQEDGYAYLNAPWGVMLAAPTLLFEPRIGAAMLSAATVVALVGSLAVNVGSRRLGAAGAVFVVLAVANLHTFDLLIRGNIDAILVVGVAVSLQGLRLRKPALVGIGLWCLTIKPLNVILCIGAILWLVRRWNRRELAVAVLPSLGTFVASLLLLGWDWPLRYAHYIAIEPPLTYLQTSMWRAFEFFGLPPSSCVLLAAPILMTFFVAASRYGRRRPEELIGLAVTTNMLITPYALGSHYVLLAPVYVTAAMGTPWLASLWGLTLTPLLRLAGGFGMSWVDIIYPAALFLVSLKYLIRPRAANRRTAPAVPAGAAWNVSTTTPRLHSQLRSRG